MEELVMLATDWTPDIDPTGMFMSEKLDGVLALWDGERLLSRNGNAFNAPAWFTRHLPKDRLLGELHLGRGRFSETLSVVRRARPRPIEWARMTYSVFDAPDVVGQFETRLYFVCQTVLSMRLMWEGDSERPPFTRSELPVYPVHHRQCDSSKAFDAFHAGIVAVGGEGTMLRRPGSPYRTGRTRDLLRRKDWLQEEATVIGCNMNEGGGLRSLRCRLVSRPDVEFDVGSGLSARDIASPPGSGSTITVKFKGLTDKGHLREPSYVCMRDYE